MKVVKTVVRFCVSSRIRSLIFRVLDNKVQPLDNSLCMAHKTQISLLLFYQFRLHVSLDQVQILEKIWKRVFACMGSPCALRASRMKCEFCSGKFKIRTWQYRNET